MSYAKQLEDEKWQVKRRKILKRDHFKCTKCGYEDNLNVHHIYYVHFKKAWQYPNDALITLCGKCHKEWHDNHDIEIRDSIWSRGKKKYQAPIKKKKGKHKKVESSIERSSRVFLDKKHRRINEIRDKKKLDLIIRKYGKDISKELFEKTRSLTYNELVEYLKEYVVPIKEIIEEV